MKGMKYTWWVILCILCIIPTSSWSENDAHKECAMCHGNRLGVGLAVITRKRKIPIINPNTGKHLERIETLCLNCHGDEEYKAQLKSLGAGIALLEDEPGDTPEGTKSPLDEMMLGAVDVGFMIIDLHETHPVGIVPKTVVLPQESRGYYHQENQLTCLGCHDHHPSNPNYKYLRWPTNKGEDMNSFCAHCHKNMMKPKGVKRQRRRRSEMFE